MNWPPFSARGRLRGLYVITDSQRAGGHLPIARAALAGGAQIIQLRDKETSLPHLLAIADEMRRLTRQYNALFIINDRADLTLCCEADGVHLGPDDLPVGAVRRLLGPHRIIGASCGTKEEALAAWHAGADYIGCGAIFGTQTKSDAGEAIGLEALREIAEATRLPVAAIGGVHLGNIAQTRQAGASMAAVITAVTNAQTEVAMTQATRDLLARLDVGAQPVAPL
jgi:thiamine-phosphate pyrophosphorylase